jgi:hypothetical protein
MPCGKVCGAVGGRSAMSGNVVIENPILNSPFEEPGRHFKFSDEGITNEIVSSRRVSSYFIPVPRAKKKSQQGRLHRPDRRRPRLGGPPQSDRRGDGGGEVGERGQSRGGENSLGSRHQQPWWVRAVGVRRDPGPVGREEGDPGIPGGHPTKRFRSRLGTCRETDRPHVIGPTFTKPDSQIRRFDLIATEIIVPL